MVCFGYRSLFASPSACMHAHELTRTLSFSNSLSAYRLSDALCNASALCSLLRCPHQRAAGTTRIMCVAKMSFEEKFDLTVDEVLDFLLENTLGTPTYCREYASCEFDYSYCGCVCPPFAPRGALATLDAAQYIPFHKNYKTASITAVRHLCPHQDSGPNMLRDRSRIFLGALRPLMVLLYCF